MAEGRQVQDPGTDEEGKETMTYTIIFFPPAQKQFDKLEKSIQERILLSLERIKVRPYQFVSRLSGSRYYKLRVGDYRVVIDIKNEQLIIIVIEVGHRKNIYKRLDNL